MAHINEIPFFLKKYDPDILKDLKITGIDVEKGEFSFNIVFYDPTDDIHSFDETGLVKKTASLTGTFSWAHSLPKDQARSDDDLYPEIESVSYGDLAVSDEIDQYVFEELDSAVNEYEREEEKEVVI